MSRRPADTAVSQRSAPDLITESALDGQEVAIAFRPRIEYPKAFRFFKLCK